jgi:NTE family protein
MIKNLVIKGGGILGCAYAGAIEVLEQNGILPGIERVAGTSAGAITACLLSLKYSGAEILQIVNSTNFKTFEDGENPLRFFTKYGLYNGDAFLNWMKQYITGKKLSEKATFRDFKNAGFLDLHVFATDLNTKGLKRFSFADSPDTIVVEAVRASMSIPLFFHAWQFSNGIPDNHIYVDGGAVYNYPLTAFDTVGDNKETLGLFLTDLNNAKTPDTLGFDHPFQYIRDLLDVVMEAQNISLQNDVEEESRTIMIDNLGISATNFSITDDQKKALYESGKKYTTAFLTKQTVRSTIK